MSTAEQDGELQLRPQRIPSWALSVMVGMVIAFLTSSIAWFLYQHAESEVMAQIRFGLHRTAKLVVQRVDGDVHDGLREGSRKDEARYQALNQFLLDVPRADPEIAYVYSAIEHAGRVMLLLDTEPPDGPDDMDVMQPYDDAPDALKKALLSKSAGTSEVYTDQWGTFITAYEPFFNRNGGFSGVIGVDLRLSDLDARLASMRQAAALAFSLGLVLAIGIAWALFLLFKRDGAMKQLQRQLGNINALLSVSKALGSNVGLDNLLPVIVGQTTSVMRAERSSLFLYDSGRKVLIGRVTEGMSEGQEFVVPVDRGVAGRVARSGEVANVTDPVSDPDFDPAYDKSSGFTTRAILAVPIKGSKGEMLGVLQALNPRDNHPFDGDDVAMMNALAVQVQVALERERLTQAALQKRKLEDSLKFAQSIQLGMLPRQLPDPATAGLELSAKLIPARMVGGDFYDFPWIDDDRIGLVMADVSGKGVPAALLMAKAMTMVRAYLGAEADPAEALRRANNELSENNDAAMFVTCFAAVFDRRSKVLTYSNAGHNESYVVRGKKLASLNSALSTALGTQSGAHYENARVNLLPDDVMFMYTDGVNEAMNPQDVEYGDAKLRRFLVEHAQLPLSALGDALQRSILEHAAGAEQSDDIAMLSMRVGRH